MPLRGIMNGAVQMKYYTHPNQGVPGQTTYLSRPHSYVSCPVGDAGFVYCGRAVVKGDIITNVEDKWGTTISPFKILPATASSTAAEVVGICLHDASAYNGPDFAVNTDDADFGVGYFPRQMATFAEEGYVHVKNYADTVEGGPVYMVINATNTWNAKIGEFVSVNTAGMTLEIPGLTWDSTDLNSMNETSVVRVAIRLVKYAGVDGINTRVTALENA